MYAAWCVLDVPSLGACVATQGRARTWPLLPGGKAGGCSPSEEKAAEEPKPQPGLWGFDLPSAARDERGLSGRDLQGPREKYPSSKKYT